MVWKNQLKKLLIACNHGSYWSFDEMDPMQTNVQSSKKIVYQNKQLTSVQTTKYQHPKTLVLECNQPLKNSDEIIYTNELLALFFKGWLHSSFTRVHKANINKQIICQYAGLVNNHNKLLKYISNKMPLPRVVIMKCKCHIVTQKHLKS